MNDSIVMTTQYIGLASGTVCRTRLQRITKLFIQVQLIRKVIQQMQMQLQQTEKKQRTLSVQQAAATREREEYNHKTEHVMT